MESLIVSVTLISALISIAYFIYKELRSALYLHLALNDYRTISLGIINSQTLAELTFWEGEAKSFFEQYGRKIPISLLNTYASLLGVSFKTRTIKGFSKD